MTQATAEVNRKLRLLGILLLLAYVCIAALVAFNVYLLHEYRHLKTLVLTQSEIHINDNDYDGTWSVLPESSQGAIQHRYKRAEDTSTRPDSRKEDQRRRNNRKDKRNKKQRRNKGRDSQASALHIHIDSMQGTLEEQDLKTKQAGSVIPYWKMSPDKSNYKQKFALLQNNGTVIIKKSGLYLIYSQITYHDRSGRWSHTIDVDGKPFIKCVASEWGLEINPETRNYYKTVQQCYTSAAVYLTKGQIVSIKSMYMDRIIHPQEDTSFWGFVKL